jgi:hypothetical protein
VTWSSSDTDVAQISNADESHGEATCVKKGAVTIAAKLGTVTAMVALTVSDAELVSIAIAPNAASVAVDQTQAFTATGTFSDTTSRDLTGDVTWSSSDIAVAQISNADDSRGQATGVTTGEVTITATLSGIPGTATLTVTDAAP